MILIPSLLMAIMFLIAAFFKAQQEQYEHAFTRFVVAAFYFYLIFDGIEIESARTFSRYIFFLLASVEILSYFLLGHFRRKE